MIVKNSLNAIKEYSKNKSSDDKESEYVTDFHPKYGEENQNDSELEEPMEKLSLNWFSITFKRIPFI